MGKGKNKVRKQNYFNLQFQQLGHGWTGKVTTLDIRKSAVRLFKDIACGNVDPEKDIEFFNEPNFTYNLKLAADDNAYYNFTAFTGISMIPNATPMQQQMAEEHRIRHYVYSIISQYLNSILIGISMNGGATTADIVQDMMVTLRPYRYVFNGNFITISHPDDGKLRVERREKVNDGGISERVIGPVKGFANASDL